jgi:hypothetical protein
MSCHIQKRHLRMTQEACHVFNKLVFQNLTGPARAVSCRCCTRVSADLSQKNLTTLSLIPHVIQRHVTGYCWLRNSKGSRRNFNGCGYLLRWPRDTFYQKKLALISPTCGGRSDDIVRLRTKAMYFTLILEESGRSLLKYYLDIFLEELRNTM